VRAARAQADVVVLSFHWGDEYRTTPLPEYPRLAQTLVDAGVDVLRVGLNAAADGLGAAVAGPRHSALRELIEARRALERLMALTASLSPGSAAVIRCAPPDETRTRGPFNQHVRTLRAARGLASVVVRPDPNLPRGTWRVEEQG
jgi:hypothetical protein